MLGKRIEIGEEIVLVVLLYILGRPNFHELFYQLLHFMVIFAGVDVRQSFNAGHPGLILYFRVLLFLILLNLVT